MIAGKPVKTTEVLADLFNAHQDGALLYKPVYTNESNDISDFVIDYCNQAMADYLETPLENLSGSYLLHSNLIDRETREKVFAECLQVWNEGNEIEYISRRESTNQYFQVQRKKTDHGVFTTSRDYTRELYMRHLVSKGEHELKALMNAATVAIYAAEAIKDEAGYVVDVIYLKVNHTFLKMFAFTEERVIGKSAKELANGQDLTGYFKRIDDVLKSGNPSLTHQFYPAMDKWFETSIAQIDDSTVSVFVNDITVQKKEASKAEQQSALLDSILKHSVNGISVTKIIRNDERKVVDGRTILANEAAVKYTGIPLDIYLSKSAVEIEPGIVDSDYFKICVNTIETGEPAFTQYFLEFSRRWLEVTVSRMDDDHIITIFTDVTSVKETQLKLERSLEELQRTNQSLQDFTRGASHDLKEPMRKVQYFADRLKMKLGNTLNEETTDILNRLENANTRMRLLVDELLELTEINEGIDKVESIDLSKVINLVLTDLELLIADNHADIVVGDLPIINGQSRQLQQLFQNLLTNSIKYRKEGTPLEISISSIKVEGNDVPGVFPGDSEKIFHCISVTDNGIGFEQEYSERIFKVFSRLHSRVEYEGSGVGLAIVKKVAENHDGYVEAMSTPGEGATFKIYLPEY